MEFLRRISNFLARIYDFYLQGFRAMKLGRTLWKLIFIKLLVIFVLLKMLVFSDNFDARFATDGEKSDFVLMNLTK